jgi:hypothetical protein
MFILWTQYKIQGITWDVIILWLVNISSLGMLINHSIFLTQHAYFNSKVYTNDYEPSFDLSGLDPSMESMI